MSQICLKPSGPASPADGLDGIEDDAAGVSKTNSTAVKQAVGLGSPTMTWPGE